ncbi:Beta-xylosidase [compost metagenome]
MTASGGTAKEHREIIGRSSHPYGPFEMCPQPILTHRGIDHPIQYLGHADLIEDPSSGWWAVFLGVRLVGDGYSVLGRETFLAPVHWSEDGWPMIDNNEGLVNLEMNVPRIPGAPSPLVTKAAGMDDFDGGRLDPAWTFLRNPAEGSWSLAERPGWLTLRGQAAGLNDVRQVAFVGRRQRQVRAAWSACLEFDPLEDGEEAGICARRDEDAHYEIFLSMQGGKRKIAARLTARGQTVKEAAVETEAGRVRLKIAADPEEYALLYSLEDGVWVRLAAGSARGLSPEDFVNKMCFTGVVVGLYATGNGKASAAPARFDWFEQRTE